MMKTQPDNLGIPPGNLLSEALKGLEAYQSVETPTLRDQFAMAALTGLLSHQARPYDDNETVEVCYEIADAMLAARQKERE